MGRKQTSLLNYGIATDTLINPLTVLSAQRATNVAGRVCGPGRPLGHQRVDRVANAVVARGLLENHVLEVESERRGIATQSVLGAMLIFFHVFNDF